ncbi:hypothetical protein C8F04DRAFT_1271591 [Mycena alexandri]|uniref:Uncharacterized protein n=1 Tax=Mycena alexandri TaxID=1745969 RepID=A0AAD6WS49_9AGAR|nr:hypothetical protein C8F04DRAFT_1271591 [Mycena alexandri]
MKQEEEEDTFLTALSGAGGSDNIFASLRGRAVGGWWVASSMISDTGLAEFSRSQVRIV